MGRDWGVEVGRGGGGEGKGDVYYSPPAAACTMLLRVQLRTPGVHPPSAAARLRATCSAFLRPLLGSADGPLGDAAFVGRPLGARFGGLAWRGVGARRGESVRCEMHRVEAESWRCTQGIEEHGVMAMDVRGALRDAVIRQISGRRGRREM